MKKTLFSAILVSLLVHINVPAVYAEGSVHIYGLHLEYRFRPNGTDQHNRLFNEMNARGFNFNIEYLPLVRAMRSMGEDKSACAYPTSISTLVRINPGLKAENLIQSASIDKVEMKALVLPGSPQVKSLEDMNGKSVAIWNGLDPKIFLPGVDAKIELTSTEKTRVQMLNNKRVDVILAFIPDVQLVSLDLGYPIPDTEGALTLITGNGSHLVCHDTPFNRSKMKQFDKLLAGFKEKGMLREVLGPHAILH